MEAPISPEETIQTNPLSFEIDKNRNTATSTINLVSTDSKKTYVDTESKHKNKQTNNILKDIEDFIINEHARKDKHKNKQHNKDVPKAIANESEQKHAQL